MTPLKDAGTALPPLQGEADAGAWEALTRLGKEIGRGWQSSQTSTELLSYMRR